MAKPRRGLLVTGRVALSGPVLDQLLARREEVFPAAVGQRLDEREPQLDLIPIPGEADQDVGAGAAGVHGDGQPVVLRQAPVDHAAGPEDRALEAPAGGELEVEEKQNVATPGDLCGRQTRRLVPPPDRRDLADGPHVDDFEVHQLTPHPAVVDHEVVTGQASHRLAVADHLHGHLHHGDGDVLSEGLRRGGLDAAQDQRENRQEQPQPAAAMLWCSSPAPSRLQHEHSGSEICNVCSRQSARWGSVRTL